MQEIQGDEISLIGNGKIVWMISIHSSRMHEEVLQMRNFWKELIFYLKTTKRKELYLYHHESLFLV